MAYLINFVLCSGLLLLIYRAFLANEKMYRFNRAYLLFSLVFSLMVPLIKIQIPHTEIPFLKQQIAEQPVSAMIVNTAQPQIADQNIPTIVSDPIDEQIAPTPVHNYIPDVLLGLYGLASLIMLIRFARNSWHMTRMITKNNIISHNKTKLVLVEQDVTPHSFLKYIFINKDEYQNGAIEPEIICHEQTHVKQLHSLDVILVELLQIAFWFNPFIPFYRKAIQLNHEFLADEAVIENYHDTIAYQYLLLAKASQCNSLYLTSQFNYSATKNRLIMMGKTTSAATAWFIRLGIVPVITIAFLLFCNKTVAELKTEVIDKADPLKNVGVSKDTITKSTSKKPRLDMVRFPTFYPSTKAGAPEEVLKEYAAIAGKYTDDRKLDNEKIKVPTLLPADRKRLEQLFAQMSRAQQSKQKLGFTYLRKYPLLKPTQAQFDEWQAKKYKVYIDGKIVPASELANHQPDEFYHYAVGREYYRNFTRNRYSVGLMTPATFNSLNKRMEGSRINYYYKFPDGRVGQGMEIIDTPLLKSANKTDVSTGPVPQDITNRLLAFSIHPQLRVKYGANDASQQVMDDYSAILKRNNILWLDGNKASEMPPTDKARLHELFTQMSKRQQDMQYFRFIKANKPWPKNTVTTQQLQQWQDAKTFGVWINNKRIKNNLLAQYTPDDFDHLFFSRLMPKAIENDGFRYQIGLMTKSYYADYYQKTMADQADKISHIHLTEKQMQITGG